MPRLPVFHREGFAMEHCRLCPRKCGAPRGSVTGSGFCGCGTTPVISRAAPHFWEEPVISGTRGSGTIFFSGCTLGCVFCQNAAISTELRGRLVTPTELADIMRRLEAEGVHNISFVTGTQYVPAILEALALYRPSLPLVWNSGGYETEETVNLLGNVIDIWLPDYKFALSEPAKRYAHAPDYPETALRAIALMCEWNARRGGPLTMDGVMKRGVIVRHLVLPGQVRHSVAALRKLSAHLPHGTPVSLMSQYIPSGEIAPFPELQRRLTAREYQRVLRTAEELGLEGFMQDLNAASEEYVPDFDLTPVVPSTEPSTENK